jgi:pimeloyl-ACP methyl ester carboxylesterase
VARFVFVHGAWHGGWAFERVAAELERRGHETWAPDLPCDQVGLTARDYAAAVGPQTDAVVVGHSLAGLTIPFVPARVRVFLAALVPSGDTFGALDPGFGGTVRDELGRSRWPDLETTHARLYPDLDETDAAFAFARLRPQAPMAPEAWLPDGSCASIVTTRDAVVRPDAQERNARDFLGVEPVMLDAGHSPFLSGPWELAELLESFA